MRVHVVGNACIDTTFRLDRFPVAGETLNAITYADGLGGKGVNQAMAAARTGAAVTLWTALGNDAAGDMRSGAVSTRRLSDVQVDRIRPAERPFDHRH